MKLSEAIRHYRALHNLTQEEMANSCHISKSTLISLENPENKKRPSTKTLFNLLLVLRMKEKDFVSLITEDEMFQDIAFSREWETQMEKAMLQHFRKLSQKGQKIALNQLAALASMEDLLRK